MDFNSETEPRTPSVDPKWVGVIAYFWVVGWIIAYVLNKPRTAFATFHLRQALGLLVLSMAVKFVRFAPFMGHQLSSVAGTLVLIVWVIGLLSALRGEERPIPVVGEPIQEWFRNV